MREAEDVWPSQNQMIDKPYVNQCQRFLHANGDELVGLARLLDARWMVVMRLHRPSRRSGMKGTSLAGSRPVDRSKRGGIIPP